MYQEYSGKDRRKFERLEMDIEVIYRVKEPPTVKVIIGDIEAQAQMLNISEGGLAMVANYNIPAWTVLLLRFSLSRMDKKGKIGSAFVMEITGEVRSSVSWGDGEYRLGIHFVKMSQKDRVRLADFLDSVLNR